MHRIKGKWRGGKKNHPKFLGWGEGARPNYQEVPRFGEGGRQETVKGAKVTGRKSWRSHGSQVFVCKYGGRQLPEEIKEKPEADALPTENRTEGLARPFSWQRPGPPCDLRRRKLVGSPASPERQLNLGLHVRSG